MTERNDDLKWILVADDEASLRDFVERALQYAGYGVDVVCDGMDALVKLQEKKYDLLLTDIVMPEMDGIALSLKAAKDYPEMKILLMTGYADQKQRAHNIDVLVHEVVSKPFSLEEITKRVAAVLAEEAA